MVKLNNEQKKGISLIVLVITIIVMIILAAAIILSLSSNGIIGRANEAKASSDAANKKQAAAVALAEYELAKQLGETTKTATEYVQDKLNSQKLDGSDVAVTEDGEILVGLKGSAISAVEKGVKLGDYVSYTPTIATSTKYKVCVPGMEEEAEDAAYFVTQSGNDALKWKYMGIDDKGNAILVSELPTNDGLLLSGADGYVNGPSKLNDLCKTLYTNASLGEARSINVEDVNRVLGAKPVGKYYSVKKEMKDNTEWLTIGEIIEQKNEPTLTSTEVPEEGKNINDYIVTLYSYVGKNYKDEETPEHDLLFQRVTIANEKVIRSNISYWLASTSVYAHFSSGNAYFSMRRIINNNVSIQHMLRSDSTIYNNSHAVRPVIVLNSNVQFNKENGSEIWNISVN